MNQVAVSLPGGNAERDNYVEALKRLNLDWAAEKTNIHVLGEVKQLMKALNMKTEQMFEAYVLWRHHKVSKARTSATSSSSKDSSDSVNLYQSLDSKLPNPVAGPNLENIEASLDTSSPKTPQPRASSGAPASSRSVSTNFGVLQTSQSVHSVLRGGYGVGIKDTVAETQPLRRSPRKRAPSSVPHMNMFSPSGKRRKTDDVSDAEKPSSLVSTSKPLEDDDVLEEVMVFRVRFLFR